MIKSNLTIVPIGTNEAKILSDLAKEIYIPHYPYLWNPGGVEWYINEFAYPLHKIEAEIKEANNLHYIVYLDEVAVGYLKINIKTQAKGFDPIDTMELERIYLLQSATGKGIGEQLIQFVKALAKEYQKKTLILKAMDSAKAALQFYQKMGFEIVGNFRLSDEVFILMKPEYRGMYILAHTIM
jgi:GNAT superfamily N-acetyltransferase